MFPNSQNRERGSTAFHLYPGATGLDYFNARYYSPAQGRFTSPDPGNAGANPADPQTWNMYAYVNNNPVNLTDPTGKGIWSTLGGIGAGIGTFFATGNPWAGVKVGMQVASIGGAIEAAIKGQPAPGAGFGSLPGISDWTDCGNLGKDNAVSRR